MPQHELRLPFGNSFYLTNRKHSGLSSHSQSQTGSRAPANAVPNKTADSKAWKLIPPPFSPLEGTRNGTGWVRG